MKVEEITEYSSMVLDILQSLLPQLSKNAAMPTEDLARRIVESNATRLLIAKEEGVVLGMLTIVINKRIGFMPRETNVYRLDIEP